MKNKTCDEVKTQFEEFLASIRNVLTSDNEINIIQNKLRRHFNTTDSDYLCSEEFVLALDIIQKAFSQTDKSTKYFTLLATFDEKLKSHSIKASKFTVLPTKPSHEPSLAKVPSEPITIIDEPMIEIDCIQPLRSTIEFETQIEDVQKVLDHLVDRCSDILSRSKLDPANNDTTTTISLLSDNESKHQRKIMKLEKRLSRLSRTIRRLEETDMSLEEMANCDLYLVESKLKKQACEVHTKLAKLKSQPPVIERIIYQPIVLNESEIGHALIKQQLQEMVNEAKHFPTFSDVLNTVEKANLKHSLNLNEETRKKFAEKSFKVIGREIKDRRMADFQDIMLSRLPENFNIEQNDPAQNNAEIERVLAENSRQALIKTEKILQEYSQLDPGPDAESDMELTEEKPKEESNQTQQVACEVLSEPVLPSSSTVVVSSPLEPESLETTVEISLADRALTILSTASPPVKKAARRQQTERLDQAESSSPNSTKNKTETLTPRRKQGLTSDELLYDLYRQKLTNNNSPTSPSLTNKRPVVSDTERTTIKRTKPQPKQQSDIIVLD